MSKETKVTIGKNKAKSTREDVQLTVGKEMWLEISETRGTSTTFSPKGGFDEVSQKTESRFNWKLRGLSAKLDHTAEDFDAKNQELYDVAITSEGFELHFRGFKTREEAIQNALEFANRNGIKVDGYSYKSK